MKFKFLKENIKYFLERPTLKFIIFLAIFLNLYGTCYLASNQDYIQGILMIFSNGYYDCFLIGVFVVNTFDIVAIYEKNYSYIIRFENHKMYLRELIKKVIIGNIILFLTNLIIMLICLNIFSGNLFVGEVYNYGINNIIYLVYYLIKVIIVLNIIAVITVLIMKLFGKNMSFIVNIILCSVFVFIPNETLYTINSLKDIRLFIGDYMNLYRYSNFPFEIFCLMIILSLNFILIYILFYLVCRYRKWKVI